MAGVSLLSIAAALAFFSPVTQAGPSMWTVPFNNTRGYGPDGPWHFITLSIGSREQKIDFYPLLGSSSSLLQSASACSDATPCLSSILGMYNQTEGTGGTNSTFVEASQWQGYHAMDPNRITGGGSLGSDQVLIATDTYNLSLFISSNVTVHSPNGRAYIPLSLLSLDGGNRTQSGEEVPENGQTYLASYAASNPGAPLAFGLHIGSPTLQQNASLTLGGYDQSRLIEPPAVFDIGSNVSLKSISAGTFSKESPFLGTVPANMLPNSINVEFSPSTPYLNLPESVCDAMAQFLPIMFNPVLGVYVWDVNAPAYTALITSPNYLIFGLGDMRGTSIRVPFSLLNLMLEEPLAAEPTRYFPCSPTTPETSSNTFLLGRAFLQAAFLAQNLDSGKLFIGQAPGPKGASENKILLPLNGTFVPAPDAPKWEDTWSGVLPSFVIGTQDELTNATAPTSAPSLAPPPKGHTTIALTVSLGLLAVIIIGCVAYLAYRRKKAQLIDSSVHVMHVEHSWAPPPPPKPHMDMRGWGVRLPSTRSAQSRAATTDRDAEKWADIDVSGSGSDSASSTETTKSRTSSMRKKSSTAPSFAASFFAKNKIETMPPPVPAPPPIPSTKPATGIDRSKSKRWTMFRTINWSR